MARTSTFTDLVTVSRASKKTDAGGWDFTNGGTVGTLTEYDNNIEARHPIAGVLFERNSSTNEIRNPRFEGATLGVIGSGGVMPTNMSLTMSGATLEVAEVGTENGWPYIDIDVTGTPSADGFLAFENSTQISAAQGDTLTMQAGLKLVRGDLTSMDGFRLTFFERTSGGGNLGPYTTPVLVPDSVNNTRYTLTHTVVSASAAAVDPRIEFEFDAGAVDFRIRVYLPQVEEKDYPTSPILPPAGAPGTSTRATEDMNVAGGAWQNSGTAFTMMCDVAITHDWSSASSCIASGPNNNNRAAISLFTVGGNNRFGMFANSGGVTAVNAAAADFTGVLGTYYKVALGVDTDNFAISATGATQATDTSGVAPDGSGGLNIGRAPAGGGLMPGMYLRDLRYFPERLTNAQLEALVGN